MCLTSLLYKFTTFKTSYIHFKDRKIRVMIADSPRRMMLGLMHRKRIGSTEGMLFIPNHEARHGIWMLNMHFNIDILWLSKNGKIIEIMENAEPCTSIFKCPTYKSRLDSFYVLELAAGTSRRIGAHPGLKFKMENINKPSV